MGADIIGCRDSAALGKGPELTRDIVFFAGGVEA